MSDRVYSTLSEFQSGDYENVEHPVDKYNPLIDTQIDEFQSVNQFIKHLPYFDKIKQNAFNEFEQIKTNLAKSIVLNELRPGLVHWTSRLQTFLNEYGLFFNKADHLKLIDLFLQVIFTPHIDLVIVDMSFSVLTELLKKYHLLTRSDLKIEWRPIYNLYIRINKLDEMSPTFSPENIEQISFLNFVSFARIYFDEASVQEMLEEWRPLMCPFDMSMNYAFDRYSLFLPTVLLDQGKGLDQWLKEFLDLWLNFSGKVYWESNMVNLFSRAAKDSIGFFYWTPYIPYIFSKLLRGLGLSLAKEISLNIDDNTPKDAISLINGFSESFSYSEIDIDSIGSWIVSMIGSGRDRNFCMDHIKKLFHVLRSYYYPSNVGSLDNFFSLLQRIPEALIERIRFERLKKYEWVRQDRRLDSFIQPSDIEELVLCMKELVLKALFSKTNFNDAIKTYQYLCFLRPDLMLPPLIEQMYASFETNVEPHRYTPLLACLVSVPRELVAFDDKLQVQKHILNLLVSVIPGIDLNDMNKLILTFQLLTNVLSHVIVCDCSPAVQIRTDLSEYEIELCQMTSNFEDFIHTLFDKLFNFIDHLANDTSGDVSDTASQAGPYSRINAALTDENVTQVHVVQMLKVLVCQSSKQILKLMSDKTFKFINGRVFNVKSGDILAYLIGYLVSSGYAREAFQKYFEHVYENLMGFKKMKNFNGLLQSERVDPGITWNLHLLSHILKSNGPILVEHIDRIKDLLNSYRSTTNKECISHMTSCFNNLITSLTKIIPKESCSVGYSLIYENEIEFFSKHMPIRDWGLYINPKELVVSYHIPNVQEVSTALELTGSILTESMQFLRKSILGLRKDDSKIPRLSKEDNYRELNYVYHVVYAASCLLKRPMNQKFITEHIDSQVTIGLRDEVNKGLGYEGVNINDDSHEYYSLSDTNRKILLNMRQEIVEFCIRLVEKLVEDKSNDTIMFILLSRILSTASSIFGMFPTEFEKEWKNHFVNKSTIQNKLIDKKYPREELIRRVMLQYEFRCFHLHQNLIELDLKVINVLSNLAINSFYSIVRDEAREQLFELLGQYQYSTLTILPNLVKFLNKTHTDKKFTKEQLEGCLLLLKGNNLQTSLLIKQNWFILSRIWPSLYKCKYFEHELIQQLLDKIYFSANLNFNSFNNQAKLSDKCVSLAYELSSIDLFESDEARLKSFTQKSIVENQIITRLMDDLINIVNDSNSSLKSKEISLFSLIFILDSCEKNPRLLTSDCVGLFVDNLVHENKNFRRISTDALCIIQKMVKFRKIMTVCKIEELIDNPSVNKYTPGYRQDNKWHLFDYNFKDFVDAKYLDKSYWGYYSWPSRIQIPSNHRLVYSLDSPEGEYSESMKVVLRKFQDPSFIKKFIQLSVNEHEKCEDTFDKKKFYLFKSLFRNFGTIEVFNKVYDHLDELIRDTKTTECSHKLAAEILSGIIRGSKYWSFEDLKHLWLKLNSLFDLIIDHITNETLEIWTECLSNSFEDQDPRRMSFYLGFLKDRLNKVFDELKKMDAKSKPTFKLTNFLQLLTSLTNFEWKIPEFWSDILEKLVDFMGHSNKLVREIIFSCGVLAVSHEISYQKNFQKASKLVSTKSNLFKHSKNSMKFVELIESKLNQCVDIFNRIHDENLSTELRKELQRSKIDELISNNNFIQTFLNWFILLITKHLEPMSLETLRLFPLLCKLDKLVSDESSRSKLITLRMYLPIWTMDQNCIQPLIEIIKQVSKSLGWRSRQAAVQMIRNFTIFNIFILTNEEKKELKEVLLSLICDDNLQVRLSSCVALSSVLHSNFIPIDKDLIKYFIELSKSDAKVKENMSKRHGGVLGLCSIVNSSPHEVPDFLPNVVTYLCDYTHDPEPIKDSVRKCLAEFKNSHLDNWQEHKLAFSEEQLSILSDIIISPNYYA